MVRKIFTLEVRSKFIICVSRLILKDFAKRLKLLPRRGTWLNEPPCIDIRVSPLSLIHKYAFRGFTITFWNLSLLKKFFLRFLCLFFFNHRSKSIKFHRNEKSILIDPSFEQLDDAKWLKSAIKNSKKNLSFAKLRNIFTHLHTNTYNILYTRMLKTNLTRFVL